MHFRTSLLALCFVLLISASHVYANFSAFYVLGDSLSDTGNLASIQGGDFPPPFFENRVTNGPVAVETLAALLGLSADASLYLTGAAQGTNYAVAGARARGAEAIDLASQTGALLQSLGNAVPGDALVVVFIGGNDARDARDAADDMAAQDIISQAVAATAATIETLANAGAASFLVVNVPDLGGIPETQLLAGVRGQSLLPAIATLRTEAYNAALGHEVDRLRADLGVKIALVNLFDTNRELLDNAAAYGLTNLVDACFLLVDSVPVFHPDCGGGANLNDFAFFDAIHPTAPVHERIGRIFVCVCPRPRCPRWWNKES